MSSTQKQQYMDSAAIYTCNSYIRSYISTSKHFNMHDPVGKHVTVFFVCPS